VPKHCQFEDQGGWGGCQNPVAWQTKEGQSFMDGEKLYFCHQHKTNKFVWHEDEVEPYEEEDGQVPDP
jgi:hypothetical protein